MKIHIPVAVSTRVARQVLLTRKHSPALLFGAGVVGMVATTVTACRATLKVEDILVDLQKDVATAKEIHGMDRPDYTEKDYKKDLAYLYIRGSVKLAKLYGPSFVLGVSSIAALTGAHRIQNNRIAGITAAYTALDKGFKEYRKRVVDEYGEDKDRELRYGTADEKVSVTQADGTKKKVKTVGPGGSSIYAKFFKQGNPNWDPHPEYNVMFLRSQQNYANDRLVANGHIMLNDVYDMLGFERTPAGSQVGWVLGGTGDDFVDFGVFDDVNMQRFHDYVTNREGELLIDFNVDGVMWDQIGRA